ncbi:MAG TPA: M48 family metallopeptidase, partial [Isosphaeraceae bacterium]
MDFFQHQETARRKTGLLVFYFAAAVVLIVLMTYAVVDVIVVASSSEDRPASGNILWNPALFGVVAVGTLLLIGGGSLYRVASLAGGGHNVAEMLGGRPLAPGTADPDERKILNVVEEMAIASGTPVPPVYLMDQEDGINAFAAGYTPGDAVIGVTRGCIRDLTRDELQGVIAHEFSHILNGDMRLNIRLMGVLYGILLISMTGWVIFRSTANSTNTRSRDDDRKGGIPWPLLGLALYILGYVGVFFGNLIKAAVSRQREYLADASAVQFTRNPEGIAGALKKIGALSEGSKVKAPAAQEASHLFFGDAVGHLFDGLATHPPLAERIRRIDPTFDGDFSTVRLRPAPAAAEESAARVTLRPQARPGRGNFGFDPTAMVASIGTVDPRQLAYASGVLAALPASLKGMAYEPFGARVIVYALLLDVERESVRTEQLRGLAACADPAVYRQVELSFPEVVRLPAESRLPLVSMAVPAIRRLSRDQFARFAACVDSLVQADGQVSLYEYSLRRLVLRGEPGGARPSHAVYHTSAPLAGSARHVLGTLATVGNANPDDAARAYAAGVRSLGWPEVDQTLYTRDLDLDSLDRALDGLAAAAPGLKKQILAGCAACIGADGRITLEEGELLHAIAE